MRGTLSNIEMAFISTLLGFIFAFPIFLISNNPKEAVIPIQQNTYKNLEATTNTTPEKMIIADLLNMRITLVGTSSIESFPIITKGKPGSYYETPVGEYEVGLKNPNHFSSLGEVYMPYSVQFYANFFIHGIPYHTDGKRVSTSYSGGCIRLADNDAKAVYNFATSKMKILIIGREQDKTDETILDSISAYNTLFTLVSLESVNQEKIVTYKNKQVKIKDLVGDMMNGNPEAKNIIYSQLGRDNIQKLLEKKSRAIGLSDIAFENEIDKKILLSYITNHKTFLLNFL